MSSDDYDWHRALQQTVKKNRRDAHNRYLQLATVRPDGTPAVRNLVFRGFRPEADRILMVTDARSEKPAQIAANSAGEICWYLTHTRDQFRLRGQLGLEGPNDAGTLREELWGMLSTNARQQFFWPEPGAALAPAPAVEDEPLADPPEAFLALFLDVREVDHLCLKGTPQRRWRAERDAQGHWQSRPVNP